MSIAEGCRVELVINCYNEDGKIISDIPKGNWYGMDRYQANLFTNDLVEELIAAALIVSRKYNEIGFGVDGINPSPSAIAAGGGNKNQPQKR